nr:hypothetical protein [Curtobacterium sp. 9128]
MSSGTRLIGGLQDDGGARSGRGEEAGVSADLAEAVHHALLEAETLLVDGAEFEADAGVGDHRADHVVVVHDRDVRLGDTGVATDVLQALREGEQERVEDVRRQEDLPGAVPADLESHPAEALLHGLERLPER